MGLILLMNGQGFDGESWVWEPGGEREKEKDKTDLTSVGVGAGVLERVLVFRD